MKNRNIFSAAILIAAGFVSTSAFAAADDVFGTVNLFFNENGYAGYGVTVGVNEAEIHASQLNNVNFAVGAGVRVADTEGDGEAGNDKVGVSATLGFAVLGAGDRIRPFGQINSELDVGSSGIVNVGVINYGLGLMDTDAYVYTGIGLQQLTANDTVANVATRSTDGTDSGTDTGTGGTGDDTGDTGDNGDGDDTGDESGNNTNPGGKEVMGCTRASDRGRPNVLEHNPNCSQ